MRAAASIVGIVDFEVAQGSPVHGFRVASADIKPCHSAARSSDQIENCFLLCRHHLKAAHAWHILAVHSHLFHSAAKYRETAGAHLNHRAAGGKHNPPQLG